VAAPVRRIGTALLRLLPAAVSIQLLDAQITPGVVQPVHINGFYLCTALPPSRCVVWGFDNYIDVPANVTRMELSVVQTSGTHLSVYGRSGAAPTTGSSSIVADFAANDGNPHIRTRQTGLETTRYYFRPAAFIFGSQTVNVVAQYVVTLQTDAAVYTITGVIRDTTGVPVFGALVNLIGGPPRSLTTGSGGEYSFASLLAGLNYTVTPTMENCTMSPPSRSFNNLTAGQTANFTASCGPPTVTISGEVRNSSGIPLSGVMVSLTGGNTQTIFTQSSGGFTFSNLPQNQSYTLAPFQAGCTFTPPNRVLTNVSSSVIGRDFTANCTGSGTGSAFSFIPVTPCRVADTRPGEGKSGQFGPPVIAAGATREIRVPQSSCDIPQSAKAYSLNFTAIPRGTLAYLSTWPAGVSQPVVSTLNSFHGGIVANAAIVPAGLNGAINVFVTDTSDVIIDINGYFDTPAANMLDFYPMAPCRAADTRGGFTGMFGPPSLQAGVPRLYPMMVNTCPVPSTARAYSLNATVVPAQPLGYLTLYPSGSVRPLVSTLNSFEGLIVANAAIVPGGDGGAINAYATDSTDLILDLNGYFAPPSSSSLKFYPLTPCRVADTRAAQGPILTGGATRTFAVAGQCGAPSNAQAFSMNVTVVPTQALGYLTLWPSGQTQPAVSTLNSPLGRVLANGAIVRAGTGGTVSAFVTNTTHVVLDINGYFAP